MDYTDGTDATISKDRAKTHPPVEYLTHGNSLEIRAIRLFSSGVPDQ
jgi:hypothetical protein